MTSNYSARENFANFVDAHVAVEEAELTVSAGDGCVTDQYFEQTAQYKYEKHGLEIIEFDTVEFVKITKPFNPTEQEVNPNDRYMEMKMGEISVFGAVSYSFEPDEVYLYMGNYDGSDAPIGLYSEIVLKNLKQAESEGRLTLRT